MSTDLSWFKSSYSGDQGECVEVALEWTKSSYSSGEGACVEVATEWTKSSHSGDHGACLELAQTPSAIHIRDSKHPEGPTFKVTPTTWSTFIGSAFAD